MEAARGLGPRRDENEHRVTPLELFFDLVFVFAITQVTQLIADRPTWGGVGEGLILLALVWWAWALYAWLTNAIELDRDRVRVAMFAGMIAMFVAALSIPSGFGDNALLFALAYAGVRLAHLSLCDLTALRALAPTTALACALVLVSTAFDGGAQAAVLLAAVAVDMVGAGLRNVANWTLHPGYFAERHGLIMIIAFGESIIATGVGAGQTAIGAAEIAAASLTICLVAAMWWAYFDVVSLVAEQRLHDATAGKEQNLLARDVYSYLHFVFIAAIVLVALGCKKTIAHVDDELTVIPAVALCGGVSLYLAGHIGLRLRTLGTLNHQRFVTATIAAALIPLAVAIPALIALALITLLMVGLILFEATKFDRTRALVRARDSATTANLNQMME